MPTLHQLKRELYSTVDFLVKSYNTYESITSILQELFPEKSIPDIDFSSNYDVNLSHLYIIRRDYTKLCGNPIQIEYLESLVPIIRTTINELWCIHELTSYKSVHIDHRYTYKIMDDIEDHELQDRIAFNPNNSQTQSNRRFELSTNCDLFNFRVNYMYKYSKFIHRYMKSYKTQQLILNSKLNKN